MIYCIIYMHSVPFHYIRLYYMTIPHIPSYVRGSAAMGLKLLGSRRDVSWWITCLTVGSRKGAKGAGNRWWWDDQDPSYRGFLNWGYPKMLGLQGQIPLKWMIEGYPGSTISGNLHIFPCKLTTARRKKKPARPGIPWLSDSASGRSTGSQFVRTNLSNCNLKLSLLLLSL